MPEHTQQNTFGKGQVVLTYAALFSVFGMLFLVVAAARSGVLASTEQPHVAAVSAAAAPEKFVLPSTPIAAHAAYVYDTHEKEGLYGQHEHVQLPLASLTKAMLALVVSENLDLQDVISIEASDLIPEGDSGFVIGERWRIRELLDFTLMTSSNDGATALARAVEEKTGQVIHDIMNQRASDLDLAQTYFVNETGLDSSELFSGAYGSAADIATLFDYLYTHEPHLLAATAHPTYTFSNFDGKVYEAKNTNEAIAQLPGIVFGKTGFTDLAGGNLAVVIEPEPQHAVVIVVLGSTVSERFSDVLSLTHAARPHTQ